MNRPKRFELTLTVWTALWIGMSVRIEQFP